MNKFVISTDSCADYLKSQFVKNQINYIILKRITNGVVTEEIYDSIAEYERFYDEIKKGALPTTSLLNEYELTEYFQNILARTEGDLVHVALSSGLSATCDNAVFAAEAINKTLQGRKIYVIDSLSASRGIAMFIDRLVQMRDKGISAAEAVRVIEQIRGRQQLWAIIGDLKHLKRGGRISGFKATVGTLLGIKPILTINDRGKLVIEKTIKGEKKAIEYILDKMDQLGRKSNINFASQTVYLIYSCESRLLNDLEAALSERFGEVKVDKGMIGPIIGTHVGDGAAAIVFEGSERLAID